jgi:hypothetical protein
MSPKGGVAWTKKKSDGGEEEEEEETLDDGLGTSASYGITKAANYFLAHEFGKRFGARDGVLHNVSFFNLLS